MTRSTRTLSDLPARAVGSAIGVLVQAIRVIRSPRPIHPAGVVLDGTVEPLVGRSEQSGISWIDEPRAVRVTGRLSRGIGTPVPMPDIWGLAVRFHDEGTGADDRAGGAAADVLVSSVGNLGVPWRFVPVPRLSPHGARFATVMPYRSPHGPVVVGVRTTSGSPASATTTGLTRELSRTPWVLELLWATPGGRWRPFATLTLAAAVDDGVPVVDSPAVRFDPVLAPPRGAATYGWTRALREPAYRAARR